MPHPLISTVVIGLVLAFILGALAQRVRISPLVGYLLAGVVIGPATPGFVGDLPIANELAEIGVILLMFGVGLHFSMKDLLSVRAIAIPGAIAQIAVATALGCGLALALGWNLGAGLVFGLALSVASTVVLLRALQERRLIETERGRVAVGWLVVEDLATVLALVLLPALAPILKGGTAGVELQSILIPIVLTVGKVAGFIFLMVVIGRRGIPWVLHYVAHTGSRELFRLAVLAIALGCAFAAATLFDVSFALGAFFAGMMMAESELSQRAASETLPLRDAFAVLFFVSVGMLFDPMILLREPLPIIATLVIIMLGKSVAAFVIVKLFRYSTSTALTISASLAQIGEFSFILAGLGVSLALLPERARDLILAGAILSILFNPLFFVALDRWLARAAAAAQAPAGIEPPAVPEPSREPVPRTSLSNHVVLIGFGRVGRFVAASGGAGAGPLLIVEEDNELAAKARADGHEVIQGNGVDPEVLAACNLPGARFLLVAVPDAFEGGRILMQARALNPALPIIARAHSDEEIEHLKKHGATYVVMGEHEIAKSMLAIVAGRAN